MFATCAWSAARRSASASLAFCSCDCACETTAAASCFVFSSSPKARVCESFWVFSSAVMPSSVATRSFCASTSSACAWRIEPAYTTLRVSSSKEADPKINMSIDPAEGERYSLRAALLSVSRPEITACWASRASAAVASICP